MSASFVAVVLLVFAAYLLFFDYPEALRKQLQDELSRIAGAPASIGSIGLDWSSYAFELRDVSVEGSDGEPFLEVSRIRGQLRLSEIARFRLHWTELWVQGLSLRLVEGAEPGFGAGGATATLPLASAGSSFAADRVVLEDAEIILSDERIPWELEASNLAVVLTRDRRRSYKGTLEYDEGRLVIRDQPAVATALSAEFEIVAGELLVHEARAVSEIGEISAKGKLGLAGGIQGRFDVAAEVAVERAVALMGDVGTMGSERLASGPVRFRGSLSISPDGQSLQGTLDWPSGRLLGVLVSGWSGDVFWDSQLLQLSGAEGRIASGRGKLQLQQPLPVEANPVLLDVQFENLHLDELVSGVRGRPSPVDSVLSGMVSLSFESTDPLGADGRFEVDGARPTTETLGEAVSFYASGSLRAGDVEIDEARVETDTLDGTLTGLYPRKAPADLVVDIRSTDLARTDALARDVRRILRPDTEPDPEPWGMAGRGRATGHLTARLPHLSFDGALSATDLEFDRLVVDHVEGRGRLSEEILSFEDLLAKKGDAVLAGSGRVVLQGPLGVRDFEVSLRASRWPATDLTTWLDIAPDVSGSASGNVEISRTDETLKGSAHLDLSSPGFAGARFDSARVRARFAEGVVVLDRIEVERQGSTLGGDVTIDLETGGLRGTLAAENFPLSRNDTLGVELGGRVDGEAVLGGRTDAPTAELTGEGRGLRINGFDLGDGAISGKLRAPVFSLDLSFGQRLQIDVRGRLEDAIPVTGTIHCRETDVSSWLARLSDAVPASVRVLTSGDVRFDVGLRHTETLTGEGTLSRVSVRAGSTSAETIAPVTIRFEDGILRIPTMSLAREGSRVNVGGVVNFRGESLDVRAEGRTTLDVIESFYPDITATGDVDLSARITGSWDEPSFSGHAELAGSAVRLRGFRQPLGDLRGRLVFDNRTIHIPELRGVFGSGPVLISGAILLEGLEPGSLDIRVVGTGMRLRYPEGLTATLDADLALLGDRDSRVLSGRISLHDAVWSREYDLVSGILSDSQGLELFEDLEEHELLRNLRFDVTIVAPESLRLRNSIAEIDASAELELRGTVKDPVLLGSAEAERGEVYFVGQRYDIVSGKIDFVDPTKVEPFIELTAETRVRSYRVELRLTGTADRFYPELSSDPPLRTLDILRLLSGASEQDLGLLAGNEEEELAGVGVATLLTERLSQVVGRRAERLFGLDRFSIDPFLVGKFANPTARVSLGKQITRDLSVNYSSNLNSTTEAIVLIEYTPEGNMSWILSRDEEGDIGIDVKFRKSF